VKLSPVAPPRQPNEVSRETQLRSSSGPLRVPISAPGICSRIVTPNARPGIAPPGLMASFDLFDFAGIRHTVRVKPFVGPASPSCLDPGLPVHTTLYRTESERPAPKPYFDGAS
jgi:hypothetical protein